MMRIGWTDLPERGSKLAQGMTSIIPQASVFPAKLAAPAGRSSALGTRFLPRRLLGLIFFLGAFASVLLVGCDAWTAARSYGPFTDPILEVPLTDFTQDTSLGFEEPWSFEPCHYRRRFGLALHPGDAITLNVPTGAPNQTGVSLRLSGCTQRTASNKNARLTLHAVGSKPIEQQLDLQNGWWDKASIQLGSRSSIEQVTVSYQGPADSLVVLDRLHLDSNQPPVPKPANDGRLIILVSLDTLRASSITALGCKDCTTPHLDRLIRQAQVFSPHYAASTWTKPSHASLLSGLLPFAHQSLAVEDPIKTPLPMVAEAFSNQGFLTTGLVSSVVWLDAKFGFSRGFEQYLVSPENGSQKVRRVLQRIVRARSKDHFVFLHLFEPHSDLDQLPYEGPNATPEIVEKFFGLPNYGCRQGRCGASLVSAFSEAKMVPLPREDEALRFLYNAGVEETDMAIGALIDGLQKASMWENTMLVVTSDHGESLLENGRAEHGQTWETVLRVPLIIKWPGGLNAGEVVTHATSAIDIVPTLLTEAAPTEELPSHLLGRPLQRLNMIQERQSRAIFAGEYNWAVIADGFKLRVQYTGERTLYDLREDPAETHDLGEAMPEKVAELAALLEERQRVDQSFAQATTETVTLTPEDRARLESLGYLN